MDPVETKDAYLRRVLPDLTAIERAIYDSLQDPAPYHLDYAIAKTEKLLKDLLRAAKC